MLDRTHILNVRDIKIETISVPEWGGEICIRTIDGNARSRISEYASETKENGYKGLTELLIVEGICDEKGEPLFTAADISELKKKNAVVLERIAKQIAELNGLSEGSAAKAKEKFPAEQ